MLNVTIAVVTHWQGELVRIVFVEHVSLLLIEELNALLGVAEEYILGVEDDLVTCSGCVDTDVNRERSTKSVRINDFSLIVASLIRLLQEQTFCFELLIVKMDSDVDSCGLVVHRVDDCLLTSLEDMGAEEFFQATIKSC